jgi:D-aminoacyl-tRNA deacylase
MRAVVQRVSRAKVTVNDWVTGEIGIGALVLLGVGQSDTEADATYLAEKIAGLRIFDDQDGKMNRSVTDIRGSVLAVSQFTLYGDVRRGKRPSFDAAAPPEAARRLYGLLVELTNEGPVTILLDSRKTF